MKEKWHRQFYRTEQETSMADLSKMHQLPGEQVGEYINRFGRAKFWCRFALLENEFIKLDTRGLNFKLRKRFDVMEFRDLIELATSGARYEMFCWMRKK